MTCIIGYEYNDKVYIGGDSAGTEGFAYTIRTDQKVFKLEDKDMILGFTTSFRMGQLLQYSLNLPKQKSIQGDFEYLCTTFIESVIKCFEKNSYGKIKNGEKYGGTFLLGYKKKLYRIEDDFNVSRPTLPFTACGAGEDFALGAMHVLHQNEKLNPYQKLSQAFEVVESFSTAVRAPFNIIEL